MIQRIQTIWLVLAATCVFLTMQFSSYVGAHTDGMLHMLNGKENIAFTILTSMVGVVSLISIFLYKNTKTQLRTILVSFFLHLVLAALYIKEMLKFDKGAISFWAILHIGVIAFLLLAMKGISDDNKLLKESNRLR
jgi:hypothetical protein